MRLPVVVLLLLSSVLAGCADEAAPGEPPATTTPPAAQPEPVPVVGVDEETPASEPDVVVLPTGRTLICALPQRASTTMLLYGSDDGANFTPLALPSTPSAIDCALGVDAGGGAYYASSSGAALLLASSEDGATFASANMIPAGPGGYDRPWIAGGREARAVAIAYDAAGARVVAFATTDGGASWTGPVAATPLDAQTFQSFGNLAWLGDDAFAFPYSQLEPQGGALEARGVWIALTLDGGATWTSEKVADTEGNVGHVFPSIASGGGGTHVAWAEERDGSAPQVRVVLALGDEWSEPMTVHDANQTGLLPRAVRLNDTPAVAYYRAEGLVDPQQQPAEWGLVLSAWDMSGWHDVVADEAAHNGTVTTGGYGTLPRELLQGFSGTTNARDLLHNLGAWWDETRGGVRLAWTRTSDAAGDPRVVTALVPA